MSALPALPALVDLYLSCLTIDGHGDIIDVDLDNWACWEAFRVA